MVFLYLFIGFVLGIAYVLDTDNHTNTVGENLWGMVFCIFFWMPIILAVGFLKVRDAFKSHYRKS